MKKIIAIAIALIMVFAVTAPAMAADADAQTIYLKGSGKNFNESWNNLFYIGGAESADNPNVWHLVYSGNVDCVTYMQLDFGDNGVWVWDPGDGFSVNGGGNNPGWVIVAPYDWAIKYVDKGNNQNVSDSYVVATDGGQFNVSGFHKGSGGDEPVLSGIEVIQEVMITKVNEKIIEKWQGEKTPYQTITQYYSQHDSTTLTNADYKVAYDSKNNVIGDDVVVPNSNHFAYAKLDKNALLAGESIDLALVNGSKVNQVGTASVSMVDGKLVLAFNGVLSSTFGAVAFDGFLPAPKNGNIHSTDIFKANNNAVVDVYTGTTFQSKDKKAANYSKDIDDIMKNAIKESGYIFLYMHANPINFDKGIEDGDIDWVVTKEPEVIWSKTILMPRKPVQEFITVEVFDSEGNLVDEQTWDNLPPGDYTVVFYDPYADDPVVKTATVEEGEMAKVTYSVSYEIPGRTTTKRIDLPFIEKELVIIKKSVKVN